ncbi:unnamed protein product [Moneuplotes crassus]|uniref:Thioredoxin domain-containing protein n=1 Tax=Euplotes crassus TaxID=5936 RepID=A0AAD1XVP2_EUPCR|nr:unnamed protein product [Moneuplotes crassus]
MDRMGQIFSGMVMNEAIKDKEKEFEGSLVPTDQEKEAYYRDEEKEEDSEDDDDFKLDDEDSLNVLEALKAKRLKEMKKEAKEMVENKAKGHGDYREITQDEFLPTVTKSKRSVVHFYHKDFERCKIVDMHLREIAKTHLEARFICLDAEKAPFFIGKLQIQVLPTIILFIDGVAVDRIVGFEELGGEDDFDTIILTRRLVMSKILDAKTKAEEGRISIKKGGHRSDSDDDEY